MHARVTMTLGLFLLATAAPSAFSHPGHADATAPTDGQPALLALADTGTIAPVPANVPGVTGQGKYRFKLLYTSKHLPDEAMKVLKKAHGGFAVDRRPGKGEVYFSLPGAGIIQISRNLKSTKMIETAPAVRDTNEHNTLIWYTTDGKPYLAFPANDAGKVFTTTLDGKLVNTLDSPTPQDDLGSETATEYFRKKLKFIPTDVEQLNGLYYITTGYSPLDYVLTATITLDPFETKWNALSFGGKGEGPGQFGTGHGITVPPGMKRLDIADRPHSEIDRFSPAGKYLSTVSLPKGSLPCDTFFEGKAIVVGCLEGPDKKLGAPIYILEDDKVVSTLMPKEDLGLTEFKHVHNAVCVMLRHKMYVIAQAWNPGDFAIMEQMGE